MDITPIINALVALIAAVITAVVVPYIRSKTTEAQQRKIDGWVKIAVTAAEQIYAGAGRGEEKKAYVLQWLTDHNITIDTSELDAMIEAAVYGLKYGALAQGK